MRETQKDSGYAWLIMCASCLNNMIVSSVIMSPAIYIMDWIDEFNSSKAEVTTVGAILGTTASLFCEYFSVN